MLLSSVFPTCYIPSPGEVRGHLGGTPEHHCNGFGISCVLEKKSMSSRAAAELFLRLERNVGREVGLRRWKEKAPGRRQVEQKRPRRCWKEQFNKCWPSMAKTPAGEGGGVRSLECPQMLACEGRSEGGPGGVTPSLWVCTVSLRCPGLGVSVWTGSGSSSLVAVIFFPPRGCEKENRDVG